MNASFIPSREREIEGRSLVHLPFSPYPAAVPMDDPLDDGHAYSGAFIIGGSVQALKDTEQLVVVLHVEADTVVMSRTNARISLSEDPMPSGILSRPAVLADFLPKILMGLIQFHCL